MSSRSLLDGLYPTMLPLRELIKWSISKTRRPRVWVHEASSSGLMKFSSTSSSTRSQQTCTKRSPMLVCLANPDPQALNRLVIYSKAKLPAFPLQFHLPSDSSVYFYSVTSFSSYCFDLVRGHRWTIYKLTLTTDIMELHSKQALWNSGIWPTETSRSFLKRMFVLLSFWCAASVAEPPCCTGFG